MAARAQRIAERAAGRARAARLARRGVRDGRPRRQGRRRDHRGCARLSALHLAAAVRARPRRGARIRRRRGIEGGRGGRGGAGGRRARLEVDRECCGELDSWYAIVVGVPVLFLATRSVLRVLIGAHRLVWGEVRAAAPKPTPTATLRLLALILCYYLVSGVAIWV